MNYKSMFASKTFWAAILATLIAVYNALAPVQKWPEIPNEVYVVLSALGLWGVRTANTTIGTPAAPSPVTPDNVVPAAPRDGLGDIQ